MSGNSKEWIINGVLLAGIVGFLAVIGMSQFSGVDGQQPPSPTPIHTPQPGPPRPGTIESVYGPGQPDAFPLIGTTEIFRDLITPSPPPPPPPPPAAQTPSLQRAVKNWVYEYRNKRLKAYHFSETGTNKEYDVKEDEFLAVPDPVTRQNVQVKAKLSGKNNVILETPDGQTVEFSP